MIDKEKLRCLQALNIQVWQSVAEKKSIKPHFVLINTFNPDALIFVVTSLDVNQTAVLALLKNIAFYLKLGRDEYNVAFLSLDDSMGISQDELFTLVKPSQFIVFGQLQDLKEPVLMTSDLGQVLQKPLLKKRILQDLIAKSEMG